MTDELPFKPVVWIGSSREDLRDFPEPVQDHMGYALYVAQCGGKDRGAKALSGFGGQGSWKSSRTIAATPSARCTLCDMPGRYMCFTPFRKNRRPGRETPRRDIKLIEQRLRDAEEIAREMKP